MTPNRVDGEPLDLEECERELGKVWFLHQKVEEMETVNDSVLAGKVLFEFVERVQTEFPQRRDELPAQLGGALFKPGFGDEEDGVIDSLVTYCGWLTMVKIISYFRIVVVVVWKPIKLHDSLEQNAVELCEYYYVMTSFVVIPLENGLHDVGAPQGLVGVTGGMSAIFQPRPQRSSDLASLRVVKRLHSVSLLHFSLKVTKGYPFFFGSSKRSERSQTFTKPRTLLTPNYVRSNQRKGSPCPPLTREENQEIPVD